MLSYHKNKQNPDQWDVFGPAAEIRIGEVVVTKKDGSTKRETVQSVSKSFEVDGVSYAYGIITQGRRFGGCSCSEECCNPRCFCGSQCNCHGGPIYNC